MTVDYTIDPVINRVFVFQVPATLDRLQGFIESSVEKNPFYKPFLQCPAGISRYPFFAFLSYWHLSSIFVAFHNCFNTVLQGFKIFKQTFLCKIVYFCVLVLSRSK